jgi:hypothetical protein
MSPDAPGGRRADVRRPRNAAGKHAFLERTDNCYSDYAQVNARRLADLLGV